MLHASDTWPLTKPNLQHLQQNDRAMIRDICNVRPQDTVTTRSNELLAWLGIEDLDLILKERRLRWYEHVERSNGAVKTAFTIYGHGSHTGQWTMTILAIFRFPAPRRLHMKFKQHWPRGFRAEVI